MNTFGYDWLEDSPLNQVMAFTNWVGVASSTALQSKYREWLKLGLLVLLHVAQICGECKLYNDSKNVEKCQGHIIVNNEEKPGLEWRNRKPNLDHIQLLKQSPFTIVMKSNIYVTIFWC